jgi:hypothetical protein
MYNYFRVISSEFSAEFSEDDFLHWIDLRGRGNEGGYHVKAAKGVAVVHVAVEAAAVASAAMVNAEVANAEVVEVLVENEVVEVLVENEVVVLETEMANEVAVLETEMANESVVEENEALLVENEAVLVENEVVMVENEVVMVENEAVLEAELANAMMEAEVVVVEKEANDVGEGREITSNDGGESVDEETGLLGTPFQLPTFNNSTKLLEEKKGSEEELFDEEHLLSLQSTPALAAMVAQAMAYQKAREQEAREEGDQSVLFPSIKAAQEHFIDVCRDDWEEVPSKIFKSRINQDETLYEHKRYAATSTGVRINVSPRPEPLKVPTHKDTKRELEDSPQFIRMFSRSRGQPFYYDLGTGRTQLENPLKLVSIDEKPPREVSVPNRQQEGKVAASISPLYSNRCFNRPKGSNNGIADFSTFRYHKKPTGDTWKQNPHVQRMAYGRELEQERQDAISLKMSGQPAVAPAAAIIEEEEVPVKHPFLRRDGDSSSKHIQRIQKARFAKEAAEAQQLYRSTGKRVS